MIAVALPDRLAATLRHAIPEEHLQALSEVRGHALNSWLRSVAQSELCVLDPQLLARDEAGLRILRTTLTSARIPCVFYTTCTPANMRALVAAFELQPVELWLAGFDDTGPRFAQRIMRLSAQQPVVDLISKLEIPLSRLPCSSSAAVRVALHAPQRFFGAIDVARHAALSRRHLDRSLALAGLATARHVVVAGKVLHGVVHARRSPARRGWIRSVAAGLGYSDASGFMSHYAEIFGAPPSQLALPDDRRLVETLVLYLTRPAGTMSRGCHIDGSAALFSRPPGGRLLQRSTR